MINCSNKILEFFLFKLYQVILIRNNDRFKLFGESTSIDNQIYYYFIIFKTIIK